MYSKPINELIKAFSKLPSVGERTAERFVFYLLKSGKKDAAELTLALKELITNVKSCKICWDFSDVSPCAICANKNRSHSIICVVAEPQDVQALEKTGAYHGIYHVLRGLISVDEDNEGELKIDELIKRLTFVPTFGSELRSRSSLRGKDLKISEVIFALNPNLEGETTMMFLEKQIKKANPKIKITRLARGLPMGSDLQYADEITLSNALKHRTAN